MAATVSTKMFSETKRNQKKKKDSSTAAASEAAVAAPSLKQRRRKRMKLRQRQLHSIFDFHDDSGNDSSDDDQKVEQVAPVPQRKLPPRPPVKRIEAKPPPPTANDSESDIVVMENSDDDDSSMETPYKMNLTQQNDPAQSSKKEKKKRTRGCDSVGSNKSLSTSSSSSDDSSSDSDHGYGPVFESPVSLPENDHSVHSRHSKLPRRAENKETLRPGDVIAYQNTTIAVAGSDQGRGKAVVLATKAHAEYPLILHNGALLPSSTPIQRIAEFRKGVMYGHPGRFKSIAMFRLKDRQLQGDETIHYATGLLQQAQALRSIRSKVESEALSFLRGDKETNHHASRRRTGKENHSSQHQSQGSASDQEGSNTPSRKQQVKGDITDDGSCSDSTSLTIPSLQPIATKKTLARESLGHKPPIPSYTTAPSLTLTKFVPHSKRKIRASETLKNKQQSEIVASATVTAALQDDRNYVKGPSVHDSPDEVTKEGAKALLLLHLGETVLGTQPNAKKRERMPHPKLFESGDAVKPQTTPNQSLNKRLKRAAALHNDYDTVDGLLAMETRPVLEKNVLTEKERKCDSTIAKISGEDKLEKLPPKGNDKESKPRIMLLEKKQFDSLNFDSSDDEKDDDLMLSTIGLRRKDAGKATTHAAASTHRRLSLKKQPTNDKNKKDNLIGKSISVLPLPQEVEEANLGSALTPRASTRTTHLDDSDSDEEFDRQIQKKLKSNQVALVRSKNSVTGSHNSVASDNDATRSPDDNFDDLKKMTRKPEATTSRAAFWLVPKPNDSNNGTKGPTMAIDASRHRSSPLKGEKSSNKRSSVTADSSTGGRYEPLKLVHTRRLSFGEDATVSSHKNGKGVSYQDEDESHPSLLKAYRKLELRKQLQHMDENGHEAKAIQNDNSKKKSTKSGTCGQSKERTRTNSLKQSAKSHTVNVRRKESTAKPFDFDADVESDESDTNATSRRGRPPRYHSREIHEAETFPHEKGFSKSETEIGWREKGIQHRTQTRPRTREKPDEKKKHILPRNYETKIGAKKRSYHTSCSKGKQHSKISKSSRTGKVSTRRRNESYMSPSESDISAGDILGPRT
jgi:hypothetical protein